MRRGTTPTHEFTVDIEIPSDATIRIVYSQCGKELVEKTTKDCEVKGNVITVDLTDEETLRFNCQPVFWNGLLRTQPVEIQIGIKTPAGRKSWSDILETSVERCLKKDGVI